MTRNVVGYLLQESAIVAEPVVMEDTGEVLRFRTTLQDFSKNRNNRLYPEEVLRAAHAHERVQELLATRTMYGEQNHPFSNDSKRQIIVDMDRASHLNVNYSFSSKKCISGVIETLAWAKGPDMRKSIVINKSQAAFSMRGIGDVEERNGVLQVTRLLLGAYDWVTFPSHKAAYMATTNNPLTESAYMVGLSRSDITSMREHLSESAAVQQFIDQFDMERPEIVITEGCGGALISSSTGRKVLAKIENDFAGDFRNFINSKK